MSNSYFSYCSIEKKGNWRRLNFILLFSSRWWGRTKSQDWESGRCPSLLFPSLTLNISNLVVGRYYFASGRRPILIFTQSCVFAASWRLDLLVSSLERMHAMPQMSFYFRTRYWSFIWYVYTSLSHCRKALWWYSLKASFESKIRIWLCFGGSLTCFMMVETGSFKFGTFSHSNISARGWALHGNFCDML